MARPSEPLTSKRRLAELALELIDRDGLAALSTRRLAERAGVHVTSLYHYFASKDDIIAAAANLALHDVGKGWTGQTPWQEGFEDLARRLRDVLREHPDLIQVISQRRALQIGEVEDDLVLTLLEQQGLPQQLSPLLIDGVAAVVIGHVMLERSVPPRETKARPESSRIETARRSRALDNDAALDFAIARLIEGIAKLAREITADARTR